jgi:hypothetical protein
MESTHKEPKAKFTISGTNVRIGSGLFFATVIVWLGYSLHRDDLVLVLPITQFQWRTEHFHGLVAWFLSGSIFCFATCLVSCLTIPMNQALHRWTRNSAWVFFFVGLIIVPIWQTHGENLPSLSDFLIGCFLIFCAIAFLITIVNLMVATIPDDWNLFAKHYPPPTRPIGNAYSNLHFRSRGQRVIFSDDGLYFYKTFLARPGHPPFLLPWASVKSIHKCRGLFRNFYIFKIKDAVAKLQLELPEIVEQELSKLQKESLVHK